MLWAITALTFLATFGVLAALFYAFSSQGGAVAERLSRLANTAAPRVEEESFVEKQKDNVRNTLAGLSKLVPGGDSHQAHHARSYFFCGQAIAAAMRLRRCGDSRSSRRSCSSGSTFGRALTSGIPS